MTEKHHFQAEIQQLLDIVIHSLYTDKEIFVRELISNAADACEKLRFTQASGQIVFQAEVPLGISVNADEKDNTVTFTDTGVGMTLADLVENLGTVAHSGTKAFLKQLAEEKRPDAKLIGQFGVGFYSAFMVADTVTVYSRSHLPDEHGWKWTSQGANGYETEEAPDLPRGTRIVLHLKPDATEFAKSAELERIIRRYSNFVQFPIELNGKRLNTVQAIWTRSSAEVKEEEYNEFYQYIGHDHQPPLYRLHFTSDAPLAIQALLFVPQRNFEMLGMGRSESGVNLHCRKVLIQPHAKNLFPEWLRFLKGIVDSEDLPLNISRETMQDSSLLQKLNRVLTGRFLKFLNEQAEKDSAHFDKFYDEFNRFLKDGIATDPSHQESLAKLLRFESSATEKGKRISLSDYVQRMVPDQKEIFYLVSPNREAAETSPYYEVFRSRGFEVLFMFDPWDEFVMDHLHQFQGKPLRAAEKADLDLGTQADGGLSDAEAQGLTKWMKETLGNKVNEIRISKRLVGSPAVVIDTDKFMTSTMRRILKATGKSSDDTQGPPQVDLEINPRHNIITRLAKERQVDPALSAKVAEQLLDNALVAAGLLEDPRTMLSRLNELLERVFVR